MQGLPSAQGSLLVPTQAEFLHKSPTVHASPSVQGSRLGAKMQPDFGSQLSVVQGFPSSQVVTVPGKHRPPLQLSPTVQTLPSLQETPSLALDVQPLTVSQVSNVQGFLSSQTTGEPTHWPLLQVSPLVQALSSSQAPGLGGCWHSPAMQLS